MISHGTENTAETLLSLIAAFQHALDPTQSKLLEPGSPQHGGWFNRDIWYIKKKIDMLIALKRGNSKKVVQSTRSWTSGLPLVDVSTLFTGKETVRKEKKNIYWAYSVSETALLGSYSALETDASSF
jgi:hypothetical protein